MDKSSGAQERDILDDFFKGQINAEECFCMILSLYGFEKAKERLASVLRHLELTRPELHKELREVHDEYFAENDSVETSVENGYYANDVNEDFGFDLEMELAVAASLQNSRREERACQDHASTTSYASKLRQLGTDHNDVEKTGFGSKSYSAGHYDKTKGLNRGSEMHWKRVSSSNGLNLSRQDLGADDAPHEQWKELPPFGLQESSPSPIPNERQSQTQANSQGKKKKKRKNKKGAATANSTTIGIPRQLSRKPVLLWFRRDIRLYDNPALVSAASKDAPVVPVFLWVEHEEGPLAAGGAVKVWLHHALACLDSALKDKLRSALVFRQGDSSKVELERLVRETGADTLILNALYEPVPKQRDDTVQKSMESRGVAFEKHHSFLLHHPDSINTESCGMRGLGSVTHFMECARRSSTAPIGQPVDAPPTLPHSSTLLMSCGLDSLGLARMPRRKDGSVIDWAEDIRKSWDFSEEGAWKAMELFLDEGIRSYEKESGRVDKLHTCRISPYLHFGQISPRAVLDSARHCKSPKFLRKLAWRDLAYWLLHLFPSLPSQPTRPHYRNQYWSNNKAHLKAWQRGKTGFPLVDACMRQLWSTGWMNNYGRHVVASFLIAYLHLHWEHGYKWFQDTLLDADVAINAMMWQNGGMSGLDQWNFVMHPVDAAMTCDPKGSFVRQWCPELAGLPDDYVHQPWKCPPSVRRRAGVELGVNYPERIITDLEGAREASLAAVVKVRMQHTELVDPHTGNDLVPLSSGLLLPVITRREFKYRTTKPDAKDNPYTAVLRGYRSRKRDELIAFENQVDFKASTMMECSQRYERFQKAAGMSSL